MRLEILRKTKIWSIDDPEKKKNEFQNMLASWVDNKALVNFVNKNIDYKDDFALIYKNHLKEKADVDFVSKFSSMSNEDLYNQVQGGNLVIWSNQYNLLPEEQRKNFENFKNLKDTALSFEKTDLSGTNNVLSMDSFLSEIKTIFNSNLRNTANDLLNNNAEINSRRNNAENLERQIYAIDDDLKALAKDIWKSMPGTPQSLVNAEISQKQESLINKRNSLLRELQIETASIQNIKDDLKYEIELMKYDDAREKENFQLALNMYNTERSRMDQFAMLDFQEKSKQMAEQRQQMFQLQIKDIDQKFQTQREQTQREYEMFKTEDQRAYEQANKKWVYQTDRNGNLLYVIDGTATPVLNTEGNIVSVTKEKWYSDVLKDSPTWWYNLRRFYDDGRLPDVFSYWVNWWTSNNISLWVYDNIAKMPEVGKYFNWAPWLFQCGEAVNNYMKTAWIEGIHMSDSYESKTKYINSQTPQVWWLAVWNPNWVESKNGHTWIVTWYNPQTGQVEITDRNRDLDGKKNTYTVPVSQINNSDGGFVHLQWKSNENQKALTLAENIFSWVWNLSSLSVKNREEVMPILAEMQKEALWSWDIIWVMKASAWWKDADQNFRTSFEKWVTVINQLQSIQWLLTDRKTKSITWTSWEIIDVSPLTWWLSSKNPWDTNAQTIMATLTATIPNLARWVYGEVWVLTDADVELYKKTIPNLKQTTDVQNAVMAMTLRWVKNSLDNKIKINAATWVNMSWLVPFYSEITQQLDRLENGLWINTIQNTQSNQQNMSYTPWFNNWMSQQNQSNIWWYWTK